MMAYFKEYTRNWALVKAYFMKSYRGEILPDTITHKITKVQQEKNKTINNFRHRCTKEIYNVSKHCPQPDEADQDAAFVALTPAQKEKSHQNSIRDMWDMFATAFFLNGMKNALKVKVMNAKPATLKITIEKAMEAKQVNKTVNQVKNKISELAKIEYGDLEELEDKICQINKERAQYRRKPFKRENQLQRNGNGNGNRGHYSRNEKGNGEKPVSPPGTSKRRDTVRKCATPESRATLQWMTNLENLSPTTETEMEKSMRLTKVKEQLQ